MQVEARPRAAAGTIRGGAGGGSGGFDTFGVLAKLAPLIFLVLLMATFALLSPRFLSPLNLFNVMRQVSIYGILAIGMTFVILTRGIDLSVGSVVALAGLVAALVAKGGLESRFAVGAEAEAHGWGWFAALAAALAVGTAAGWLQGVAITRLGVPPFVVTLGGMSAFRGAALLLAGGGPISGFDEAYRWWGQGYVGPVPVQDGTDLRRERVRGHGAQRAGVRRAVEARVAVPHQLDRRDAQADGLRGAARPRGRRRGPVRRCPG